MEKIEKAKPLTVTMAEAENLSGLGPTTLYEKIKQGILKSTKVGRRRLVIYESLEQLVLGGDAA